MARTMKDSGVEWIGKIPVDWDIKRLKYSCETRKTKYNKEFGELDYFGLENIVSESGEFISTSNEYDLEQSQLCMKNDVVFGKLRPYLAKVFLVNKDRCCSGEFAVFTNFDGVELFYKYLFLSYGFIKIVDASTYGTKMPRANIDFINNMYIPVPSSDTQKKIAEFLDSKVGEINAIISKTRETIEEYKKYKQAVITEVALGGLDKSVATRNSGIDWIGNIPEHWKIKPFKFVMTERNEKNIPVKTDKRLALSIDKGITTYAEKTTNLDRFKDDVTQYKLAYEGDLVFNSMNMIVGAIGYSNYFGCVSPVYYTYYDNVEGHYTSKYYEYIFRSKTMRKVLFSLGKGIMAIDRGDDKINTCRLKVSRDDLRCLKVPVPMEQEQQEIVKYLDAKCADIDALIAKKESFVEEMETYKKSLIYEYVTGKKEVK